jgi:hypothetical protein
LSRKNAVFPRQAVSNAYNRCGSYAETYSRFTNIVG